MNTITVSENIKKGKLCECKVTKHICIRAMDLIGRVLLLSNVFLCIQAASPSKTTLSSYVVSVQDTEVGAKVTLIPMIEHKESPTFATKVIPDQKLSPDCGDQFYRCQPLHSSPEYSLKVNMSTISGSSDNEYILLVPLHNGILLLEIRPSISNQNLEMVFGSSQILTSTGCSPTTVFKIYDSYYTMCTDLQNRYISLYEVRLNSTHINQSQLLGPLVSLSSEYLSIFTSADVMNMSNFLLYTDIPHQPFIYFAIDNYLFTIAPLDWSIYDEFSPLGSGCRKTKRLVQSSGPTHQLLAYCLSEYVYYDLELQYWLSEHTYENSGVPYICPNQNYEITVKEDYLEYRIGSRMGTLSNVDFDNGLCLNGTASNNFFTYIDKTTDSLHIFNLTSASETHLESVITTECSGVDCIPLELVGDRYLVIQQARESGMIHVLDIDSDFRTVVSVDHQTPSLVTIVQVKTIPSPTVAPNNKAGKTAIVVIVCVIIPITILVSVAILAGVLFLLRFKRVICLTNLPHPCEDIIVPIQDQPPESVITVCYPQLNQETDNGRDKGRIMQPHNNNEHSKYLEESEIVPDKKTDEVPAPQISGYSTKISENATSSAPGNNTGDINGDSIVSNDSFEPDTQPLLK